MGQSSLSVFTFANESRRVLDCDRHSQQFCHHARLGLTLPKPFAILDPSWKVLHSTTHRWFDPQQSSRYLRCFEIDLIIIGNALKDFLALQDGCMMHGYLSYCTVNVLLGYPFR
jgi:hypothetical protein